MSTRLRAAEEKWGRSTKAAFDKYWSQSFRRTQTYDDWAKGIADFLGISVSTVKKSLAAQNFRAAQKNAGAFRTQALKSIGEAVRTHAWSKGMKEAFGGRAAGVASTTTRRRRRKSTSASSTTKPKKPKKPKAKSTKTKSTKKKGKGGKKTVYPTKAAAKSAATKGRYPYKVKGGYSLSKKQKKK